MSKQKQSESVRKLPSPEEIEAMSAFPSGAHQDSESQVLCLDLNETWDELASASSVDIPKLKVRMKAIIRHMKALHCAICLPS